MADKNSTVADIGDEPMQFHQNFPDVTVVVGEKRAEAIATLLKQKTEINAVLLDDAYQHRAVAPGLNILLTSYTNLFTDDWYLPAGSLRDLKSNYKRADIIIVTKCDASITENLALEIIKRIKPLPHQKIFFTNFHYGKLYNIFNDAPFSLINVSKVLLVTGIANPKPIVDHLQQQNIQLNHLSFGDHHKFSEKDINNIIEQYGTNNSNSKIILTTEKDATRLKDFEQLKNLPVFALPVQHCFLFNEAAKFNHEIKQYVKDAQILPVSL